MPQAVHFSWSMKVYAYKNCDTCRRALKWLNARGIEHDVIAIREQPPTVAELRKMLAIVGDIKRLFNTSGTDYKALGLKDRVPDMPEDEALTLLSENGNLVKRPFALWQKGGLVGFREDEWTKALP